jgi:hypothetical protein
MMTSSPSDDSTQPAPATISNNSVNSGSSYSYGPGISHHPGFSYRNVWRPLAISFIGGQTKEIYLDVADRGEPPTVSDGYCISLAYVVMLDIVR